MPESWKIPKFAVTDLCVQFDLYAFELQYCIVLKRGYSPGYDRWGYVIYVQDTCVEKFAYEDELYLPQDTLSMEPIFAELRKKIEDENGSQTPR